MIDAHQHFWNPARGDYGWMPVDDPVLSRPYGPAELAPHLTRHGITQTVLVQAAPSIAESEYMLGIADATPFVAGVVGWVDFEKPSDRAEMARLARHPKFKGVRPMIQDIPTTHGCCARMCNGPTAR
jgi:L-fuconolactonase